MDIGILNTCSDTADLVAGAGFEPTTHTLIINIRYVFKQVLNYSIM